MQQCNISQTQCSDEEPLKEMMSEMLNFIKNSTDLVEKLKSRLECSNYDNKRNANKSSKGCRGACKRKKEHKRCAATSTSTGDEAELIAKHELDNVLNKVFKDDKKDKQCGCDDLQLDDIEEMKLKLRSTIKDLQVLHTEIKRLESKTIGKFSPGPNATPNPKILYRYIMKDASMFEDLEKPGAANVNVSVLQSQQGRQIPTEPICQAPCRQSSSRSAPVLEKGIYSQQDIQAPFSWRQYSTQIPPNMLQREFPPQDFQTPRRSPPVVIPQAPQGRYSPQTPIPQMRFPQPGEERLDTRIYQIPNRRTPPLVTSIPQIIITPPNEERYNPRDFETPRRLPPAITPSRPSPYYHQYSTPSQPNYGYITPPNLNRQPLNNYSSRINNSNALCRANSSSSANNT